MRAMTGSSRHWRRLRLERGRLIEAEAPQRQAPQRQAPHPSPLPAADGGARANDPLAGGARERNDPLAWGARERNDPLAGNARERNGHRRETGAADPHACLPSPRAAGRG
jgi:hypothetical protein